MAHANAKLTFAVRKLIAEAFNKTLQREWAYQRPYYSNRERLDALPIFLQDYNYARPHTSIGNKPPASRL